jgi:hypothetical protein
MKNFILFLIIFSVISCKDDEQKKPQKSKGIPNALQEKSVDVSGLNKRKDTDLVEILYKELLDKDASLQQLEDELNKLEQSKDDSLKTFSLYEKNNKEYYSIYEKHLNNIKDSFLRKRTRKLLDSSLQNYKKKIAHQQKVYDSTNEMYTTISDLHWLLKLSKTLAVMENYQDNNIPDTLTLRRIMEKLNGVIQKTDSLMKTSPGKASAE